MEPYRAYKILELYVGIRRRVWIIRRLEGLIPRLILSILYSLMGIERVATIPTDSPPSYYDLSRSSPAYFMSPGISGWTVFTMADFTLDSHSLALLAVFSLPLP